VSQQKRFEKWTYEYWLKKAAGDPGLIPTLIPEHNAAVDEIEKLRDDLRCIDVSGLQHEIAGLKEKLATAEAKIAKMPNYQDSWGNLTDADWGD
jgi:hypothetical protein